MNRLQLMAANSPEVTEDARWASHYHPRHHISGDRRRTGNNQVRPLSLSSNIFDLLFLLFFDFLSSLLRSSLFSLLSSLLLWWFLVLLILLKLLSQTSILQSLALKPTFFFLFFLCWMVYYWSKMGGYPLPWPDCSTVVLYVQRFSFFNRNVTFHIYINFLF